MPLSRAEEIRLRRQRDGEEDAKLLKKVGLGLAGLVIVGLVVYVVWGAVSWFANGWERDNKAQILALTAEVEKLKLDVNYDDAERKNNDILTLAGDRKINDPELREVVDSARQAVPKIRINRFMATVQLARRLQESKLLKEALKKYDEANALGNSIQSPSTPITNVLANAKASRAAIFPEVRAELERDEADAARLAAEAERREAVAKEQAKAADLAEERRQEELRKLELLKIKYKNAPKTARDALNALKRIQAKTEVGVTYVEYGKQLGDSWGDVKIFVESPEGKEYSDLSERMHNAILRYQQAGQAWKSKIDGNGSESEIHSNWAKADVEIKALDLALNQQ